MSEALPAHSKLGPSSSERWLNCHGSVKATAGLPDTSSSFAAEGTAAHELAEMCAKSGKKAKAFLGEKIEAKGETFEVNGEMATAVQSFLDYVEALPGDDNLIEERVHYDAFIPGGFGTADSIRICNDGNVYVTDLKYGKGVWVSAQDNPQLKLYALGVFQDYGHLYDMKHFYLAVHQPRLDHIDEWDISVEDLLLWVRDTVVPAYESAMGENPPFAAGEWCRFCGIKTTCETRAQAMQAEYLADLDGPMEMSGDELAELLAKLPEIRAWCNDVEAHALSEIQKGNPVGDYKLVEGRSTRTWKDEAEAEKALRSAKLKVKEIFPPKLITPPQAEKILGKNHPLLKEHVKKPPGKPVMVPGSDPRPPLQVKAEDEFDDLDNAE